ncbi:hypothetical protein G9C98_006809 [Cotesia typhae]|uniref:Major facilitator superfamily (MFS) profile domain-containing protein n=1 Tax=Cotesia typhae TaxID=2053667 RepID=A0A8J5R0Z7_9HYME|nr:hypothetical protein G9C98_006809 [Cotesia typhae]
MVTTVDSSIEGRYKEYQYEALATSLPVSPLDLYTTLDNKPDNNYSSITYVDNRADPCDNKAFFNSKFNKMEREKGSKLLQFIAATAANIAVVAGGATLGWTSPILLMLKKDPVSPDNPIGRPISEEEASWIGSLTPVGQSVEMFYVARFIFGVALSISFAVLPMYCGEIAETSIRGILGSFLQLFITIGLLWAYSIGPYVSYTSFWISCAALPIAFFILFFTMPESPYYLAAKGRKEDVVSALMTGINVVLFYSENIFASAGNSGISSSIETIIVGIVQFLASGVTPLVVDRLGRKILLIISGTGTAISLGILGLFFYLKDAAKNDVSNIGWLPVASLIIFIATYSIGWGPLPWTVMGEMFSTEIKSKASGIVVFACWFLGFLITKYFSNIAAAWGQYTAFWLFGVFCVLSVLFTVFILPETKGKSLQEIQDKLSGTNHK